MTSQSLSARAADRLAIGLSGLCAVHCVATTLLAAAMASAGGLLGSHWLHEGGLALAVLLAGLALWRGIAEHGFMLPAAMGGLGIGVMAGALSLPHSGAETMATLVGVGLVAFGHRLNSLARD